MEHLWNEAPPTEWSYREPPPAMEHLSAEAPLVVFATREPPLAMEHLSAEAPPTDRVLDSMVVTEDTSKLTTA